MKPMLLAHDELRRFLRYDQETGVFTWLVRRARINPGDVAGTRDTYGYVQITVAGTLYLAHRLAWLYMTGVWPQFEIDHRNRVRHDNRWRNLRPATRLVNMHNRTKASAKNTTGLLGVSRNRSGFAARITSGGKVRFLGIHATPELAHAAYMAAKRDLHTGFLTEIGALDTANGRVRT